MTTIIQGDQVRAVALGIAVEKSASPTNGAVDLFVVSGKVLLVGIVGEVTTVMSGTTTNLSVQHDPTIGSAAAMCAATEVTSDPVGTLYGFDGANPAVGLTATLTHRTIDTGEPTTADAPGTAFAPLGGHSAGIVLAPGVVQQLGSAANTGVTQWTLLYVPLDDGASVVAA